MALHPDHLITFATVARLGSVSAGAIALHRSQPAISLHLKALSEAAGETLYTRHRHGVALTAAGESLLPHAQAVVRAMQGAERSLRDVATLAAGSLRISASMTVAVYVLPPLLAKFRAKHPGLELTLLTRNSAEAVALLEAGEADLSFTEGPAENVSAQLETNVFARDEIILVTQPDRELAKVGVERALNPKRLNGLAVVRREPGSGTREVVDRVLQKAGLKPVTVLEATGLEAVKEGALQDIGAAFLSKLAVRRELEAGLLVEVAIKGLRLERDMTLLHPVLPLCSHAARAFLKFVA